MRTRASVLLSLLVLPFSLLAQKPAPKRTAKLPDTAFNLISVKVVGTTRYKSEQVAQAAGLEIGQKVSDEDFQRAAARLGETGVFSEVQYSFEYAPDGTKLTLQVKDTELFVPARFDNLVWFTDDELAKELHARVPLYSGELPVGGNLADQLSEALQALLVQRNIPATVNYIRSAPQDGPVNAFVYSVTGPNIRVHEIHFQGAGPEERPGLEAAAKRLEREEYLRSALMVQAEKDFLPIYLARGYLKASFSDPRAKVVESKSSEDSSQAEVSVDVEFTANPGLQYKAAGVEWVDNKAFSAAQLSPLLHLPEGQPANAVRLDADLRSVTRLYGSRGFIAIVIRPTAQFDDPKGTVAYRLVVHEGDVYKMGELDIQGLDSKTTSHLIELWKLPAGETYDSSYPQKFFDETYPLLPNGPWNITIHQTPEPKDKTVDVTLRYDPKP